MNLSWFQITSLLIETSLTESYKDNSLISNLGRYEVSPSSSNLHGELYRTSFWDVQRNTRQLM